VMICRQLKLLTQASVAVDGSKFKAVNNRDRDLAPAFPDAVYSQCSAGCLG
jgi:hypothetical protein